MSERARDIESKYSLVEIIANSTFYLPGSVLSSLHILTYLIKQQQSLMQVLFCIYFTDEEVLTNSLRKALRIMWQKHIYF